MVPGLGQGRAHGVPADDDHAHAALRARCASPRLAALLAATNTTHVVDLGSGAGGPWPALQAELSALGVPVHVTCTDLAPHAGAAAAWATDAPVHYHPTPVSATAVPDALVGARTMFSALHHFTPDEVRALLASVQSARVAFAAFEATSRSGRGVLATLAIPFAVLALMPTVRPRNWRALLCTYVPPLLPLTIWWDGIASTLRTYRIAELEALIVTLPPAAYVWEVVELPGGPLPVLAVLGHPLARAPLSRSIAAPAPRSTTTPRLSRPAPSPAARPPAR